jgi:hypothetical protein
MKATIRGRNLRIQEAQTVATAAATPGEDTRVVVATPEAVILAAAIRAVAIREVATREAEAPVDIRTTAIGTRETTKGYRS